MPPSLSKQQLVVGLRIIIIITIINVFKTSGTGLSWGKTKLYTNCIANPTNTSAIANWKKLYSRKQQMFDLSLQPIQPSSVKHSVGQLIPHTCDENLFIISTPREGSERPTNFICGPVDPRYSYVFFGGPTVLLSISSLLLLSISSVCLI